MKYIVCTLLLLFKINAALAKEAFEFTVKGIQLSSKQIEKIKTSLPQSVKETMSTENIVIEATSLPKNFKTPSKKVISRLAYLLDMEKKYSSSSQFQALTYWRGAKKNKLFLGDAPKNPHESFTKNFTNFITDKNYSCKKPAMHYYFVNLFDHRPFGLEECPDLNKRVIVDNNKIVELDPKRIFRVYYVVAEPSKTVFISRWGHSMLQLVICAPHRQEVDSKCIKDTKHHIYISFRADDPHSTSLIYNPTGLVLESSQYIIERYNLHSSRSLTALPLRLSEKQIRLVGYNAIEKFWTYRANYGFLRNNCATEILDFIQSFIPDSQFQDIFEKNSTSKLAISPYYVLDSLKASEEISDSYVLNMNQEDRIEEGYFYPTFDDLMSGTFKNLSVMISRELTFEQYMKKSKAKNRKKLWTEYFCRNPQGAEFLRQIMIDLELIIKQIYTYRFHNKAEKVSKKKEYRSLFKQFKTLKRKLELKRIWREISPESLIIPNDSSLDSILQIHEKKKHNAQKVVEDFLLKFPSKERKELKNIDRNIEIFSQGLESCH